jgi:hypothetical protein
MQLLEELAQWRPGKRKPHPFIRIIPVAIQGAIALPTSPPVVPPLPGHLLDTASLQHWHDSLNPVLHPSQSFAHLQLQDWQCHNIYETSQRTVAEKTYWLNSLKAPSHWLVENKHLLLLVLCPH